MNKYEEALGRAKSLYGNLPVDSEKSKMITTIFPELRESKDERITRAINNMLPFIPDEAYANNGVTKEDVLAWLEKQKEHLYIFSAQDFEGNNILAKSHSYFNMEQKPAEWSEEDEEVMEDLYNFVISDFIQDHIHEARWKPWKATLERNRQNRLKSLSPSWKPSEEQMKSLIDCVIGDEYDVHALVHLWAELKKL